nr:PREDICTED: homeobox protein CDX-2 [Apteryx mantelli mantelli]
MYVSYLLDKDGPMYPSPVRHSGGLNLAAQNFVGAPQYADYGGYHVNLDSAQSPGPAWPAPYGAPFAVLNKALCRERRAGRRGGLILLALHRRRATMERVKTRTKDKYRVVYTDHQRLELEKEFHYSRYITIRRKAELASNLGLSERQVCPSSGAPGTSHVLPGSAGPAPAERRGPEETPLGSAAVQPGWGLYQALPAGALGMGGCAAASAQDWV